MIEKVDEKITKIKTLDAGKPRKKIAILGAGMAGLTAAFELSSLGHEVYLYEANDRVGGRAWTQRFNVSEANPDGHYHELGAMRFHTTHDYTHHYAKECGLTFRPFVNHHGDADTFYFFKGILSKHSEWDVKLVPYLNLAPEDLSMIKDGPIQTKSDQILNLLVHPLVSAIKEVYKNPDDVKAILALGPITENIKKLDSISLGSFLKQFIKSEDALDLIGTATGLEVWWDKAASMFIRDEIMIAEREKVQGIKDKIEEIVGGTDKLPLRLFEKVKQQNVKIFLKTAVFSLTRQKANVQIGIKDEHGKSQLIDFDHVICTLPFPILRRIKLGGLSNAKMNAIRNLTYASSVKVLLLAKERFWELKYKIVGGASQMDLINRQIYYPSDNFVADEATVDASPLKGIATQAELYLNKTIADKQVSHEPGVLVGSYCWGQDARRLGGLSREERANVVKEAISNIHPEIMEEDMVMDHASIFWDEYKFTGGAFSFMKPGDFTDHYQGSIKSEGTLYFAGEHCSLDNGWIQGAIISSLNAVEELVKNS